MKITLPLEPITASNHAFIFPEDVVLSLGGGKRPPVLATINGVQIRARIAPMGGKYLLGLTKANFGATGVEAGQSYELSVELDAAERTVEVPDDLAAALADDASLRAAWDGWSYTNRKEAARTLTEAKKPETRERRLAKIISSLSGE